MSSRAQAALEFLMTYGWAIMIVLAAIGALAYFGVLTPGNFLPNKCTASPGWSCVEKPLIKGTTISQSVIPSFSITTAGLGRTAIGFSGCTTVNFCGKGNTTACTDVTPLNEGQVYTMVISGCSAMAAGQSIRGSVNMTLTNPNSGLQDSWIISITGKAT